MRRKNYKGRCVKISSKKSDSICKTYDEIQFEYLKLTMLNEFIEKIVVHERADKGRSDTTQEIEIYFNFIGHFVPPCFVEAEPTPEEIAEREKKELMKQRQHQNYLRRKAKGLAKLDYEKYKDKKKADVEAGNAQIHSEDIAKGIFVHIKDMPPAIPKIGKAAV